MPSPMNRKTYLALGAAARGRATVTGEDREGGDPRMRSLRTRFGFSVLCLLGLGRWPNPRGGALKTREPTIKNPANIDEASFQRSECPPSCWTHFEERAPHREGGDGAPRRLHCRDIRHRRGGLLGRRGPRALRGRGFVLVDDDAVCLTNINRQIIALRSTIGKAKVEVMRERILAINPEARVEAHEASIRRRRPRASSPAGLSYVVDAIDTVSSKIDLILRAKAKAYPIMSAMGAGNQARSHAPRGSRHLRNLGLSLARVMRRELKGGASRTSRSSTRKRSR